MSAEAQRLVRHGLPGQGFCKCQKPNEMGMDTSEFPNVIQSPHLEQLHVFVICYPWALAAHKASKLPGLLSLSCLGMASGCPRVVRYIRIL
jgi:hypothetical protein